MSAIQEAIESATKLIESYRVANGTVRIGYLICDLMHYCKANGLNFEAELANAKYHFDCET